MGVITIQSELCKACYACVRNCPVKAIKVEEGKARIVEDRCISCGSCIKVCSQNAKVVKRDVDLVLDDLKRETVVALIAPSFPASFPHVPPFVFYEGLRRLGFAAVHEATMGVEATLPLYQEQLIKSPETVISSYCPAIVGIITKYFPDLVPLLAPVDSAVNAAGKILATEYPGSKVVFIGPCLAKKEEAVKYGGECIDAVLTFKELKELFKIAKIELDTQGTPQKEDNYLPQSFPISGGLAQNLGKTEEILVVDGAHDVFEVLNALRNQTEKPRFLDILFCKGCIDGPEVDSPLDIYARIRAVQAYAKMKPRDPLAGKHGTLNYHRAFNPEPLPIPKPSEKEIRDILKFTYKNTPEDELNCGACGYTTCREKAIAVYQGLAEMDMCFPYLIHKSRGETRYYKDRLQIVLGRKHSEHPFIGENRKIIEVSRLAERSSVNDLNVLLQGESGVGKRQLALLIHGMSLRRTKPFLEVECANPELLLEAELFGYEEGFFAQSAKGARNGQMGKLEQGRGGVIFFKHLEEMPMSVQAKLVRCLQDREFERMGGTRPIRMDVRFMGSTHVDLRKWVSSGRFRADLFYRLNVVHIPIAPLRERISDIPLLVGHFLEKITLEKNLPPRIFADQALEAFQEYPWPGNVRELYNVVERAIYISDEPVIGVEQLPQTIQKVHEEHHTEIPLFGEAIAQLEKDLILKALHATNNNRAAAAKRLGIPRATLYLKLKDYEITESGI